MTSLLDAKAAAGRHCFTFCGERCDCPAREFHDTLEFILPALPVLKNMLKRAHMGAGANKASEMETAVRAVLAAEGEEG